MIQYMYNDTVKCIRVIQVVIMLICCVIPPEGHQFLSR